MKHLGNCELTEFLVQTGKIRHAVSKWLDLTQVLQIRKRHPEIPATATKEERNALLQQQTKDNLNAMLDAILDEHPRETAELIGLCCFTAPEDLASHTSMEYMGAVGEMIGNEDVINFFISLAKWAPTNTLKPAKQ